MLVTFNVGVMSNAYRVTAQTRFFSLDVPLQTGRFFSIAPAQDNVS